MFDLKYNYKPIVFVQIFKHNIFVKCQQFGVDLQKNHEVLVFVR